MTTQASVITRFAPSPTGLLHIGNVRTAILNWLFARANNGKFILRIDDTDKERSTQKYEDAIKRDLEWLGLGWDATFKQSERMDAYYVARDALTKQNRLYPCYETTEDLAIKKKLMLKHGLPPIYDREALKLTDNEKKQLEAQGIKPYWRFFLLDKDILWFDSIRGDMHFKACNIPDPVLFKENGSMTYNLASVVDDIDYGITHIMRGEDHLTNTATHVQLFEALNATIIPQFAHFSLLYNKNGEISKRLGGFDIASLRENGIEPMTINSFFARVGSSATVECCYSLEELSKNFSLDRFSKSPVNYDFDELHKFNVKMIHHMPHDVAKNIVKNRGMHEISELFWQAMHGNIDSMSDMQTWYDICYNNVETIIIDSDFCRHAVSLLPDKSVVWNEGIWDVWIDKLKQSTGKKGKELFLPIRLALTGKASGPEMRLMLALIGREKAISRLMHCNLGGRGLYMILTAYANCCIVFVCYLIAPVAFTIYHLITLMNFVDSY